MTTTPFLRARSEEQREARRGAILAAAAQMLAAGTLVHDLTLNGLARRVGLAKSNVLRYFESREAVLLTLLDEEYSAWLDEVARLVGEPAELSSDAARLAAVEDVADVLSRTVVERPVLSELMAHAQLVLEQNVSAEVAADYKRRAIAQAGRLVDLVERRIGVLPAPSQLTLAAGVTMAIGGVWAQCRPSPGMAAAYERYPELAALRIDQRVALRELVATLLVGLLARPARSA
jgi:AcrR family transcriptional regulator